MNTTASITTSFPIDHKEMADKLQAPFEADELEWRIQQAGESNGKYWAMVLAYVTNRAIMDRLDTIVGFANWQNEFAPAPDGGVMCGLKLRIANDWIVKWDGAENTSIEKVKGGLSNSMKRAAVQWGIGRYLYKLETNFVTMTDQKPEDMSGYGVWFNKETKKRMYWKHPSLPVWALPIKDKK